MPLSNSNVSRSWESVCGDCAHFFDLHCNVLHKETDPHDSIAAVCEWFESEEGFDSKVSGEE